MFSLRRNTHQVRRVIIKEIISQSLPVTPLNLSFKLKSKTHMANKSDSNLLFYFKLTIGSLS